MTMKTLAILAVSFSLLVSACATDEAAPGDKGRPPLGKPQPIPETVVADIEESFDPGTATQMPLKDFDDGRLTAETVGVYSLLHRFNETLGVDEIGILDDAGDRVTCCFIIRSRVSEIDHAGLK
jgi:hypothetical protein